MDKRTSKTSAKVAKKAAAKRVAARVARPRKTAPKSQSRKAAKPALLAGGFQAFLADGRSIRRWSLYGKSRTRRPYRPLGPLKDLGRTPLDEGADLALRFGVALASTPKWRKWHTRKLQELVPIKEWWNWRWMLPVYSTEFVD